MVELTDWSRWYLRKIQPAVRGARAEAGKPPTEKTPEKPATRWQAPRRSWAAWPT
ncbi:hypothetical protein J7F03_31260 [Streptomyces sp. ISL-43]|uniref:hypothetical protein n=1 Tax=Streptomyces sp. ISL-43 TaxID=2819183 RepID=UPI001BE97C8A|nr:hypothetical protein [Streptomyces sp. ISL-43]MBT2451464.1 hypothetical protein [Streptomyces sp. ISL-43]